jgi:hypothetical protein
MRKSFLLSLLAVAGTSSGLAAQEFEGMFTVKVKDMPGGTLKTFMKGGKYRMEVSMEGQSMAIIADPAAGETYMLVPQQQMAMVMKMSDAEKLAGERAGTAAANAKLEALGKKEEIAGHSCDYYRISDGTRNTDVCLATGLGTFRGGSSLFAGPPGPRSGGGAPSWAREVLAKGAFPLKVVDGNGKVLWEVTAVERKTLEAELFVVPANFQRMAMPSFGRPPAD